MKKSTIFFTVVFIVVAFGCSNKKFDTEEKGDHLLIKNNIAENLNIKNFSLVNKKKFKKSIPIHLYLHEVDDNSICFITHRTPERKIIILDESLNIKAAKTLKKGRGPGEVGSWLPGMGMSDNEIYILDNRKNSIEIFNKNLEYKDSYQINSSDFRMNFGFTGIDKLKERFLLAPVISMSEDVIGAKINNNGKLAKYIKGEKPSGKIESFSIKNLVRYTKGPEGNLYMVMIGYENKYMIRKYNPNLKLVWENHVNDELQDVLSPKFIRFKDGTFELEGGRACTNLDGDEKNIYSARSWGDK